MITIISFISLLIFSSTAVAENICPPYKAVNNEPTELIIKEKSYSYENAMVAIKNLGQITIKPSKELKGSEKYINTANSEIVLQGYILSSNCITSKDPKACQAFCQFMQKEPMWFD